MKLLAAAGVLLLTGFASAQQGAAPSFSERLAAAKKQLAGIADKPENKTARDALQARIGWLERGAEYDRRLGRTADARLDALVAEADAPPALPPKAVLGARWDDFDPQTFEQKYLLKAERAALESALSDLSGRLEAFVETHRELGEKQRAIEKEASDLAQLTLQLQAKEKEQVAQDLAAVEQKLAATGEAAPKGAAKALLELEREVLTLAARVVEQEGKNKTKWRDAVAKQRACWKQRAADFEAQRIKPLRAEIARGNQMVAKIAAMLLPEVELPAGTPPGVREVFTRCRQRVASLLERVAERAARNTQVLAADSAKVQVWLDESQAAVKASLDETLADQQLSQAVLYFKIRTKRDELERALSKALKDERWESLPIAISALKSELDSAAEELASVESRFEGELRSALGTKRGKIDAAFAGPMKDWVRREREQALAFLAEIEKANLLQLGTLSKLQRQRDVLEGGLKDLERRGLFLRDPSKLTARNLQRVGELWVGDAGELFGALAGLPGAIWERALHPTGRTGTGRLRLVIAALLPLLAILLTVFFKRRRDRLLAGVGDEPQRRVVHQLALAGFLWRGAFLCGVGGSLLVCSGITTLSPEDRSLCAALGWLLTIGTLWWSFAKVCVRPLRPRLRLLPLDDAKARRLHWLSTIGLCFWIVGQIGAVTYWLVPDVHGRGAAAALEAIRDAGLLAVVLALFWMPNLLRQLFPSVEQGGVRMLQGFVMLLMWPARLVMIVALVLWGLSYYALAVNLGLAVVGVLGAVVAGVISHQTIREEFRFRFFRKQGGEQRLVGEYLEILELVVSLGLVFFTFSLVQGLDLGDWSAVCAIGLWGESKTQVVVGDVLLFVAVLFLSLAIAKRARRTIEVMLTDRSTIDKGLRYTLGTITSYVIVFLGVLFAFGRIQLGFERLQWLIAALSVGIGFGLQAIISNFFSGLILLFERPLRVGDVVKVGDTLGEVRKITIRSTTITSFDNIDVIVPNKDFITQAITNWTGTDRDMRSQIEIGVAYGSDLKLVREVLLETIGKHGRVYKKPAPAVYLVSFADSSINFSARYWTSLDYKLSTFSDLHFAIEAAFAREGIEIPFPQSDVRLKEAPSLTLSRTESPEPVAAAEVTEPAKARKTARTAATNEPEMDAGGGAGDDL